MCRYSLEVVQIILFEVHSWKKKLGPIELNRLNFKDHFMPKKVLQKEKCLK